MENPKLATQNLAKAYADHRRCRIYSPSTGAQPDSLRG